MLEPGTQLGRYEIQRRLGRGGMGTVYVAHDPVLGRMVAIKVFAGELDFPDARERFSREARSAAALSHPNIVTVYDFGEFDSQPFIVMEYVPGETLAAVIRRKADVRIADKLRWIDELCAGAGYAHEKSVIHRDIKPANLMIDRSGRLKILDFGIARMMGAASNTTAMIGTPGYMAPEQIEGKAADHRADLFSIGVVSYELFAYTEAFPGDTIPAITHRILSQDPVPLTELVADVDPDVVAIIERALKKNAADRFEDAESMRAALARIRRQLELDVTSIRPADAPRRDLPPPRPSRGTGSARSPMSADLGVASLTPPPDRISADPDALARLRVTYLEAALESARTLFDQGQLSAALAACHQALAYDATNAGALELEARIESAMLSPADAEDPAAASYLDAPPMPSPTDAPDPRVGTAGGSPTGGVRRTNPASAQGTPADRTVLRPARRTPPPKPIEPTLLRPSEPPIEPTLLRPSEPPIEPTLLRPSEPPMEPTLLRPVQPGIVPPSEATVVVPSRRTPAPQPAARTEVPPVAKAPKPAPDARRPTLPAVDFRAKLKALSAALPAVDFQDARTRKRLIWAGAGVLAIAVIAAGIMSVAGGPAPTGTLVVDAVPWATVSAVVTEDGEPQTLPSPASTPLALTLPAGNYEVVLVGPPPDSQEQRVSVRVEAQTAVAVPPVRFRPVTPEEYFEQYLAAPVETPPAPAPDAPAPAVSTPATGVSQ